MSEILSIVSIIIAILLFILEVRINRRDDENRIDHTFINSFNILKGLSILSPEFEITCNGEPILNDVRLIQGEFSNAGRKDINTFDGVSDIKLILPDGCIIKKIVTFSSKTELKVTPKKDEEKDNVAVFGIKKFMKPKESFNYTILFEATKEIENIQDHLDFYLRIEGTSEEIKSSDLNKQIDLFRKSIKYFFNIGYLLATLPIYYLLADNFPNLDRKPLVVLFIVLAIVVWFSIILATKYCSKLLASYLKKRWQKKNS